MPSTNMYVDIDSLCWLHSPLPSLLRIPTKINYADRDHLCHQSTCVVTQIAYTDLNHICHHCSSIPTHIDSLCSLRSPMSSLYSYSDSHNLCWHRSSLTPMNTYCDIDNLCRLRSSVPTLNTHMPTYIVYADLDHLCHHCTHILT